MKTQGFLAVLSLCLLVGAMTAQAGDGARSTWPEALGVGEVAPLTAFAAGNSPEGIAVIGPRVFVANRRVELVDGVAVRHNVILRVMAATGETRPFARLPDDFLLPGSNGVLGLAVDAQHRLYAALDSKEPTTRGVYRISASGKKVERLPGSENMTFPNAITFDADQRMYVTDSETGEIWRYTNAYGVPMTPWVGSVLLAPLPGDIAPGLSLPGANGIAFVAPDQLYVANTEQGLLAGISINVDDSAGDPRVVAQDAFLLSIDGVAAGKDGHIYAVIAGYHLIGALLLGDPTVVGDPVVRIDPATGNFTAVAADPGVADFDFPLSLAFGATAGSRTSLFVVNGDLPLSPTGPGAGVVEVGAGVSGQ
jgi:sugar lactone lactonase YvrE